MESVRQINTKKISKEVAQHIIRQMKKDSKDTRHNITYTKETHALIKSII